MRAFTKITTKERQELCCKLELLEKIILGKCKGKIKLYSYIISIIIFPFLIFIHSFNTSIFIKIFIYLLIFGSTKVLIEEILIKPHFRKKIIRLREKRRDLIKRYSRQISDILKKSKDKLIIYQTMDDFERIQYCKKVIEVLKRTKNPLPS